MWSTSMRNPPTAMPAANVTEPVAAREPPPAIAGVTRPPGAGRTHPVRAGGKLDTALHWLHGKERAWRRRARAAGAARVDPGAAGRARATRGELRDPPGERTPAAPAT